MDAMGGPARRGAGRPFVGRDREVADLVAGLEDAIAGRMRLLLIASAPAATAPTPPTLAPDHLGAGAELLNTGSPGLHASATTGRPRKVEGCGSD